MRYALVTACSILVLLASTPSFSKEAMDVKTDILKSRASASKEVSGIKGKLLENMKIEGVFLGGGRSFAIIDGRVYHEGDFLLGHKLRSIQRGGIVLERGGRTSVHEVGR